MSKKKQPVDLQNVREVIALSAVNERITINRLIGKGWVLISVAEHFMILGRPEGIEPEEEEIDGIGETLAAIAEKLNNKE